MLTQSRYRKGVSFLSRFSIIGSKKKDADSYIEDDESELGDLRTEGMNAAVFSSSIGANGYIPQHKEPPRYIKVRAHNKKDREFNRMFLAQELVGSARAPTTTNGTPRPSDGPKLLRKDREGTGAVWAAEFSKDGKYLAAAGEDHIVRIWAVISTSEERAAHEQEEDVDVGRHGGERLSAPVFRSRPIREFQGHADDVLDLSWSKNNFLLSSSMDKTVRLWHVSRAECLCTFKHKDFVTSIAFHPKDDRFFLAGSLDSVLRLWSIPDKSVAFWAQMEDLITAVAFTPDGKTAIAGGRGGLCTFYETEGLKYHTQIYVRSSRGKNAKGHKITGIKTIAIPPEDPAGEVKVLISSNDSRVRLYNLRDKSLEMKFRGHLNPGSQIRASFSDDARYVITGSEDRKAYIWSTCHVDSESKDKRPVEQFQAHSDVVTATLIAPAKTRRLLGGSGDPIYDLCNPPPVTLLSAAEQLEKRASTYGAYGGDSVPATPGTEAPPPTKKPEESPAYVARAGHNDGNIVITADRSGTIKVFRQDCAYAKRRHDQWETGSTFSRKLASGSIVPAMRSASIMSRATGPHSRRNSVGNSSVATASTQLPSERILNWRNSIASNNSLDGNGGRGRGGPGSIRTFGASTASVAGRSERSVSPGKTSFSRQSSASWQVGTNGAPGNSSSQPNLVNSSMGPPPLPTTTTTTTKRGILAGVPKPASSITSSTGTAGNGNGKTADTKNTPPPSQPPTPSFTFRSADADRPDGSEGTSPKIDGQGKPFWSLSLGNWRSSISSPLSLSGDREKGASTRGAGTTTSPPSGLAVAVAVTGDVAQSQRPSVASGTSEGEHDRDRDRLGSDLSAYGALGLSDLSHRHSVVSKLSDECSEIEGSSVGEEGDEEAEVIKCSVCGGKDFRARRVGMGVGLGGIGGGKGKMGLVCRRCGAEVKT
jgi:WD40 repeat protein